MSTVDEVKQKIDIVSLVGEYAKLSKSGRTFRALCPFHSERTPSFFVYPERQSWHCFGACNTGGDAFSFVMKKEGIGFGEALRLLAQKTGVTISERPEPGAGEKDKDRLYQVSQAAVTYYNNLLVNSPAGEKARNYLAGRGISTKTIADFQLGFSLDNWEALKQYLLGKDYGEGDLLRAGLLIESETGKTHDRFRGRLMFPIFDVRGHAIGFGARALDDSMPKYLNSPQTPVFDKSDVLYGLNVASQSIRQLDMVVIVEGYMDVLQAHQSGINNVIASMGTAIAEKQVNRLKKLTRNLALALDADAAGEEAMLRSISYENTLGGEIRVVLLPEGKDPDDVVKEGVQTWQDLVAKAMPVLDYTFNVTATELDITTALGKSQVVSRLLPIIAEIRDITRQDHYLNKLSQLTATSYRNLEKAIARLKSEGKRVREPVAEIVKNVVRRLVSSRTEEYCLSLLLQHPELKDIGAEILPEYFESSENREIFLAWQRVSDISTLKQGLDSTIHDYFDSLLGRVVPSTIGWDKLLTDCVCRLREDFQRNLAIKRAQALSMMPDLDSSDAGLAELQQPAMEISAQLKQIFTQKGQRR